MAWDMVKKKKKKWRLKKHENCMAGSGHLQRAAKMYGDSAADNISLAAALAALAKSWASSA